MDGAHGNAAVELGGTNMHSICANMHKRSAFNRNRRGVSTLALLARASEMGVNMMKFAGC